VGSKRSRVEPPCETRQLREAMPPVVVRLPDNLKELVDRQAEFVEYRTFDPDVGRLIRKLRVGEDSAATPPRSNISGQSRPAPAQPRLVPPPLSSPAVGRRAGTRVHWIGHNGCVCATSKLRARNHMNSRRPVCPADGTRPAQPANAGCPGRQAESAGCEHRHRGSSCHQANQRPRLTCSGPDHIFCVP
jgi:hypothetical protein